MKKEKGNYYVKNKDLLYEILKYKESKIISEELGLMILKMSQNYAKKGSFKGYTWKEDMISDAILIVFKYMHNFKIKEGKQPNPFAYITTIIHNSFVNDIKKYKKHSKIKDICYNQSYLLEENHYYPKAIDYQSIRYLDKKK